MRIEPIVFSLLQGDVNESIDIAHMRQDASVKSGRKNRYGMKCDPNSSEALDFHITGASGERAVAIYLGCPHEARVDSFGGPDLLDFIQVRTRGSDDYDLLVRSKDKANEAFVHVTTEDNRTFTIHGYLMAHEAKKRRWIHNHGGREPAFFVPVEFLSDISSGIERRLAPKLF